MLWWMVRSLPETTTVFEMIVNDVALVTDGGWVNSVDDADVG